MAPLLVAISNILAHRCRGVGVIHTIIGGCRPHVATISMWELFRRPDNLLVEVRSSVRPIEADPRPRIVALD